MPVFIHSKDSRQSGFIRIPPYEATAYSYWTDPTANRSAQAQKNAARRMCAYPIRVFGAAFFVTFSGFSTTFCACSGFFPDFFPFPFSALGLGFGSSFLGSPSGSSFSSLAVTLLPIAQMSGHALSRKNPRDIPPRRAMFTAR
ncbi:MAG: hypothetical protein A4E59_01166 [Syntrophorhabdus sp. PtaB.Bin027]|nr:MAG: hypothetical protein A4E59_01166 [Syntrophorhabdus sp. PtaB.Bin027]